MSLSIGIAGGSVGGLFAAVLLSRLGHQVTVLERARHGLARRGAGLVVQEQVSRILDRVGLASIAERGVWADQRIALDPRGTIISHEVRPQMQMSWDLLYDGFRKLLPDERYLTGATVTTVESTGSEVRVTLEGGRSFDFDLLIGADGQGSVVRRIFYGDNGASSMQDTTPDYAGYVAWRGLVAESSVPRESANDLFGKLAFHFSRGTHVLGYLVPGSDGQTTEGERRYNWVWYRQLPSGQMHNLLARAGRPGALSLGPGELPHDLHETLMSDALSLLPPQFAAAVAAEAKPFMQPIYDYESVRMAKHRVVLLGDAAFIARPHTAMGVAKAAGDAMALAAALAGRPVDDALAAYEKARLPQGRAIVDYGRRLGMSLTMTPHS